MRPALREHLRTHKVSQKEQNFNLIILSLVINKFSIKSYVVDVYQNRRGEEILIPIRNICGIEASYALTATNKTLGI